MDWIIGIVLVVLVLMGALMAFNLITAQMLRRDRGYTTSQMKTHIILRETLISESMWHLSMSGLLTEYIRSRSEEELLLIGSMLRGRGFECQSFYEWVRSRQDRG